MKNNQSFHDFTSVFPVEKASPWAKQDTIRKAALLLSQQTKYAGGKTNFVLNQLKSISKVFWLIQLLCFGAFLLNFSAINNLEDAQILFLTIVPVMTFYILPELLKAQLYNTGEIEGAFLFNPLKSLAVKMVLVSGSNILIIGTASLALGLYHQLNIFELFCRGLIPFHISVALAIAAFDFIKISSPYGMLSVSALLTIALLQMRNYSFLFNTAWLGAYFGSILLMLSATVITAIRLKYSKERCYGA